MTQREEWEHYVGLNWTNRFGDPPEEKEEELYEVDWSLDAGKLSDEEISELANKIEEISRYDVTVDITENEDGVVDSFKVYGSCNEDIYDEIVSCIDDYNVTYITA